MTSATRVLELGPDDLTGPIPPWDVRLDPGMVGAAVIDGSAADWRAASGRAAALADDLRDAPVVTVAVVRGEDAGGSGAAAARGCDLLASPEELDDVLAALERAGAPALVAAQLLRGSVSPLTAESFAYSMLLGSEDFAAWRATTAGGCAGDEQEPRVRVERVGTAWRLTLTRPRRHNAFDRRMREELCDALDAIASAPPAPVVLVGAGPSFCSGGDLDEFGAAASPVAAHLVRSGRSVARRLARIGPRLVAGVHGRCIGAGVEFAAYARRVVATPGATFALPELAIGLNLGAGGSVSIPARIGRHRTLALLLSGEAIAAGTALEWGLVDEIVAEHELSERCQALAEELA
jgi:enoyl-CoA hydratase/carnithine racemase